MRRLVVFVIALAIVGGGVTFLELGRFMAAEDPLETADAIFVFSGTRVDRCIVSFNAGGLTDCIGAATPWIGCNLLYSNGSDAICSGDQGTNSVFDPLFCDRSTGDFTLAENSPAAGGTCHLLGALGVACPAQGVATAVQSVSWSHVKRLFSN